MQIKKKSYIDHIIINNTREGYPLPGPGSHFHDKKTLKKYFDEDERELIATQERKGTKKPRLP